MKSRFHVSNKIAILFHVGSIVLLLLVFIGIFYPLDSRANQLTKTKRKEVSKKSNDEKLYAIEKRLQKLKADLTNITKIKNASNSLKPIIDNIKKKITILKNQRNHLRGPDKIKTPNANIGAKGHFRFR